MTWTIEPMHEHHLDDVVGIEARTSATPWSATTFLNEINSPMHILLVALVKNKGTEHVIGFTGGQIIGDELHVHSLAVDLARRRCGVGIELVRELMSNAYERDARKATLEVRVSNDAAHSLYAQLGFVDHGIRPKYYQDNSEDATIMWCDVLRSDS